MMRRVCFSPSNHAFSAGSAAAAAPMARSRRMVKSSPLRQSCRSASSNSVQFMTLSRARLMLCCHGSAQAAQLFGLAARRSGGGRATRAVRRLQRSDRCGRMHRRRAGRGHHVIDRDQPAATGAADGCEVHAKPLRERAHGGRRAHALTRRSDVAARHRCFDELFVARRHAADDRAGIVRRTRIGLLRGRRGASRAGGDAGADCNRIRRAARRWRRRRPACRAAP